MCSRCFGLILLSWVLASSVFAESKPNIILCMADDQGWGDTGYNGHPVLRTPNLDKMAEEGIRFQRFYAGAPVCSPTRGSCLTGRHPYRYGIFFANVGHMKPQEITLAEVLKQHGYTTGHFGKWHLGTLTTKIKESTDCSSIGVARRANRRQNVGGIAFLAAGLQSRKPSPTLLGLSRQAGACPT